MVGAFTVITSYNGNIDMNIYDTYKEAKTFVESEYEKIIEFDSMKEYIVQNNKTIDGFNVRFANPETFGNAEFTAKIMQIKS